VTILLQNLGRVEYVPTVEAMQRFTEARTQDDASAIATADALWICEHPPVFTQGLAGKPEHLFNPHDIPVIQTNRGGQITYHGPGQVMAYPLIDLKRAGYFVKEYVYRLEEATIKTLLHFGVTGHRVANAPGIYVRLNDPFGHAPLVQQSHIDAMGKASPDFSGLGKIAALGIKVSRHCTYHGMALNVSMDLTPYSYINPCGYARLQTVDLFTMGVDVSWQDAATVLGQKLSTCLPP